MNTNFNTIEEALSDLKAGKMLIVVDDENRENEGDLLMAAEFVTSESINFMARYGRGLICTPMTANRLNALEILPMVQNNTDVHHTAFTVSVDAKDTKTGISAFERAKTIQLLLDPMAIKTDFNRPGHIFPLIAKENGVLERAGHTEAAVDLARIAGLKPAGVICEIMNEDGSMARLPELIQFKQKHNLKLITIASLIEYRRKTESMAHFVTKVEMPTKYGNFQAYAFTHKMSGKEHIALVMGDVKNKQTVLVRIHSECLTGDVFGSLRCDCGQQLNESMRRIAAAGNGVLIYLRQEGRGIGLINKLKAYKLQDAGLDTVEANEALGFAPDLRNYTIGGEILAHLGVRKIKLMTNNPDKIAALDNYGIEVIERIHIEMNHNEKNQFYMKTKALKMGHILKGLSVEKQ
ncbi:MAG TPA: bifunctional 3,4-dihydroxy-2-butanone-4-phosphate synthase/GTP cyclohydrolase II [Bacteroidales bacterium]|nr:bifunctional 3,4-dihydroxy-2-butanone-4-phosphate synthase/GTP cyclohydrolase II [Bacteroidales bacterium]